VDWSAIPATVPSGGAGGGGGEAGEQAGSAGTPNLGEGGASGEGGAAGEAGFGGEPDLSGGGGTGGTVGGGGGGKSGDAGEAGANPGGGTGGTPVVSHPTCSAAPTQGLAGASSISEAIVFYDGGTGTNGARGGRAMLDAKCDAARVALHLTQPAARAVISVDMHDDIFQMPEKYHIPRKTVHVVSPLGIEFAPSWNAIWQTGATPSMVCTGIMPPGVTTWLTGTGKIRLLPPNEADLTATVYGTYEDTSTPEGVHYDNACNSWTLGTHDTGFQARVGLTTANFDTSSTPRFFFYRLDSCDAADGHVLCAAFNPTP
jgi:hypothetical protein